MKMSLKNYVKKSSTKKLFVKEVLTEVRDLQSGIATIVLMQPIDKVIGSQRIQVLDSQEYMTLRNVSEVKMRIDDHPEAMMSIKANKVLVLSISAFLDVSRAGKAWLVKQSFESMSRDLREKAMHRRLGR